MYDRARRWATAQERDRIRRMAELEQIVESAISALETQQITRPSPVIAERLAVWREQLREDPARRAG
jgi:hypothetical protein